MLRIRLLPIGKTHAIKYRLAVVEGKSKLTGDPKEIIGSFDPTQNNLVVKQDRLDYWLKCGAQPTTQIKTLCKIS